MAAMIYVFLFGMLTSLAVTAEDCTMCSDTQTRFLRRNGIECSDFTKINDKCRNVRGWRNKKFCQQTCFEVGLGYEGDVCCTTVTEPPPTAEPTGAPTTEAPVPRPTVSPTALIVVAEDCTMCSDTQTRFLRRNGIECSDFTKINDKCRNVRGWRRNKYCQQTCFEVGLGYEGDVCCTTVTEPPSTTEPTGVVSGTEAPAPRPTMNPTSEPTDVSTTEAPAPRPTMNPTRVPTPSEGNPSLTIVGTDPTSAGFPLDNCQGDCDGDGDCNYGRICFQRDGVEAVPGCEGGGEYGSDYCIIAPDNTLVVMGDNDAVSANLGRCQGDCDSHNDCVGDLKCWFRNYADSTEYTHVPGCDGVGRGGEDYCYDPADEPDECPTCLRWVGNDLEPSANYPLQECQGDCDNDTDCAGSLKCYNRNGVEEVPGCSGKGKSGVDYCYDDGSTPAPAAPTLNPTPKVTSEPTEGFATEAPAPRPTMNPTRVPTPSEGNPSLTIVGTDPTSAGFPLDNCQGDCDGDGDCNYGRICFQRDGVEAVPGCEGGGEYGSDYCIIAPDNTLVVMGDNDAVSANLGRCQGDCDSHNDCVGDLKCWFRNYADSTEYTHVPGCDGVGRGGEDYCYDPADEPDECPTCLRWVGNDLEPSANYPLQECQGDCDNDTDCAGSLKCYNRNGVEEVPGCSGKGKSGVDYCYNDGSTPAPAAPTLSPTPRPTAKPGTVTYFPGDLSVRENGLKLSKGLISRIIAQKGQSVQYPGGGASSQKFHSLPDGAAIFVDPDSSNPGGWIYASNSESSSGSGGVGSITFDSNGDAIDYKMVLTGTSRNCGGGKSYWDTWLTCEETSGGGVWEVDPAGKSPGRLTLLGGDGDEYESVAYDNRDQDSPTFYVTTDRSNGPVLRFSPDPRAVSTARSSGDYSNMLHSNDGGGAKIEYLVLSSSASSGTFRWTDSKREGEDSAGDYFQNSEGIDIRNGLLYLTCKTPKKLFILDLDKGTYTWHSTESGAFNHQPDQVARLVGGSDILYFCEDGGSDCGVHGRDATGRFYTILESDGGYIAGETSGLAFSPDNMRMYVSFQSPGIIMEITREDGFPFGGQRLDIKYHAE